MSRLKLKRNLSRMARRCGLLYLASLAVKHKAFVLMYHRILNSVQDEAPYVQPGMYVLASTFRSHLEYLKNTYEVIPLQELVDRVQNRQEIRNCCAITLDDGWLDNYVNAFPIIRELNLPVTIFLATEFIGTDRLFWPEELTLFLDKLDCENVSSLHPLMKKLLRHLESVDMRPDDLFNAAIEALKTWPPEERQQLLSFIRKNRNQTLPNRKLMNWDEARKMQASGLVSFGVHTANHVLLDQISLQEAENEILAARQAIKNSIGVEPSLFSYPNGNYTPDVQLLLKKHGYAGAVITRRGRLGKQSDLFEIPRIGMHQDVSNSVSSFQARTLIRGF